MTDYIRDVGGRSRIVSTSTPPIGGNTRELQYSGIGGPLSPVTGVLPYPAVACTVKSVRAAVGTPSAGQAIRLDVKKNGVTILAAPLTIAAGQQYSGRVPLTGVHLNDGDLVTVDIVQVGTTTPGSNLVLILEVSST
jgi:hypothetical protein